MTSSTSFFGRRGKARRTQRVGVVDGAIDGHDQLASLAALFPHVTLEPVAAPWPTQLDGDFDILITAVSSGAAGDLDEVVRRLKASPKQTRVVVVLRDPDVATTRSLMRDGAADVLLAPVSAPALALSLERLLAAPASETAGQPKSGEVVTLIKAGGGVGATSLATQIAVLLAAREGGAVCLADLDLQFGAAALYLDLPEALSIADCLSAGQALADTPFATALAAHRSGARVLAARVS